MTPSEASARLPDEAYSDVFQAVPVALLVIRADDLVMVDANPGYLTAVGMSSEQVVGRHVFDVFPNSPLREDDQATDLRSFLTATAARGEVQTVEGMRYDIPDPSGGFDVRYWNVSEVPLLGADGRVELLLHFTEDVTELHRARDALALSRAASALASAQVTSLAEVALALTGAETVEELERVVVGRGASVLQADGGAVVSRADDGGWRVTVNQALGEHVRDRYGVVPFDSPLPAPTSAREGRRILLPDRAAGLAHDPGMAEVYADTRRLGWAFLPLTIRDVTIGALAVSWVDEHRFTEEDLDLLEALAAQCAQTLSRIQAAEEQRRTTQRVQELAEALQSAMLTEPPRPDHLDITVRYRSAVDVAQVGGDWYDAFLQPDGATTLVIGDVVGHDNVAAGKMGQLRGLLRALAYDAEDNPHGDAPSAILTRFEHAARGLAVDELATAVLARVEQVADAAAPGGRRRVVRWSNAGNPPPVVVHPDGTTRLLDPKPDLLLGVDPTTDRHDHVADLPDGCTLLLFTDGLVERRETSIDEGIDDLRTALVDLGTASLSELCDVVLRRLAPHTGEDDIAMIAVRGSAA